MNEMISGRTIHTVMQYAVLTEPSVKVTEADNRIDCLFLGWTFHFLKNSQSRELPAFALVAVTAPSGVKTLKQDLEEQPWTFMAQSEQDEFRSFILKHYSLSRR